MIIACLGKNAMLRPTDPFISQESISLLICRTIEQWIISLNYSESAATSLMLVDVF